MYLGLIKTQWTPRTWLPGCLSESSFNWWPIFWISESRHTHLTTCLSKRISLSLLKEVLNPRHVSRCKQDLHLSYGGSCWIGTQLKILAIRRKKVAPFELVKEASNIILIRSLLVRADFRFQVGRLGFVKSS